MVRGRMGWDVGCCAWFLERMQRLLERRWKRTGNLSRSTVSFAATAAFVSIRRFSSSESTWSSAVLSCS